MRLSIAVKLWLPTLVVTVALIAMSVGSAVRTVRSQAETTRQQSEQQAKLEGAARWSAGPGERHAAGGRGAGR